MGKDKVMKVPGYDSFQRINYLYQISKLMTNKCNRTLSSYYGSLLINIAKKNVLKIHPDVKRYLCKKCHAYLVEGQTMNSKYKTRKHQIIVVRTCLICDTSKCFHYSKIKDNRVWTQKPEAIVERIKL